jgi:hypothetical protein
VLGAGWLFIQGCTDIVLFGVRLLNTQEKDQLELLRERLEAQINKVPQRVANGSVQETRGWLQAREEAKKMLRKSGVNAAQILSMLSRLR